MDIEEIDGRVDHARRELLDQLQALYDFLGINTGTGTQAIVMSVCIDQLIRARIAQALYEDNDGKTT